MRIAYVSTDPGVPIFGAKGSSIHVQEVCRALRRAGADVVMFADRIGGTPSADLSSMHVVRLPEVASASPEKRELLLAARNAEVGDLLEQHGPFEAVYERHALWSSAAMEWARAQRVPGLLEVNAPLVEEQQRYRSLANANVAVEHESRAMNAAAKALAVSEPVAAYIRRIVNDSASVMVVPNGVDPGRFMDCARRVRFPWESDVVVGFVGTLKPWHGLEVLMDAFDRAFARRPDLRLVIIGDGPMRAAIETDVERRCLASRVTMTGVMTAAQVARVLERVDIAVAPYPAIDGFYFSPLKLFEYMAAGSAIIASDVGQISGVIEHERTGLLTPPGDSGTLCEAMLRLAADAEARLQLGAAAQEQARRHHTWDAVAMRILQAAGLTTDHARHAQPAAGSIR